MTAGNKPALTAEEWLSGIDKGQDLHVWVLNSDKVSDSGLEYT